jgi:hypothetical protein
MATRWFCDVAERAGSALPDWIGDFPIMFDNAQNGIAGPSPVTNRCATERWVGFVFSTIKRYSPETLSIRWETNIGPLAHGQGSLDRDLFSASLLAIDLARLTTASEIAASQERAICSPFTVPSMEEQGFEFAQEISTQPTVPENYALGRLVDDLRRFGENYWAASDQIRDQVPGLQKGSRLQLASVVTGERERLNGKIGFSELRDFARTQWNAEMNFVTGRRIVGTIVEKSKGRLTENAVESLTLGESLKLLQVPEDTMTETMARSDVPQSPGTMRGKSMTVTPTSSPLRDMAFISYSHRDRKFLDQLLDHLKPLKRAGTVSEWSDKQIAPGSEWFVEIQTAIARSKVAVLLVTSNFLASDFIHEHELAPFLKEAEQGGVRVLWIPIRACSWQETPLKKYHAVCDPNKPLAEMKAERDKVWVKVCEAIKEALK